jgi:hypothetical protein
MPSQYVCGRDAFTREVEVGGRKAISKEVLEKDSPASLVAYASWHE